jgi:hypothetical protein
MIMHTHTHTLTHTYTHTHICAAESEQRAALTALELVAGSCNYHMLLPKQYVQLWKELGQVQIALIL